MRYVRHCSTLVTSGVSLLTNVEPNLGPEQTPLGLRSWEQDLDQKSLGAELRQLDWQCSSDILANQPKKQLIQVKRRTAMKSIGAEEDPIPAETRKSSRSESAVPSSRNQTDWLHAAPTVPEQLAIRQHHSNVHAALQASIAPGKNGMWLPHPMRLNGKLWSQNHSGIDGAAAVPFAKLLQQQQQQQQHPSQKLPQKGSGFRANCNFRPYHDGAVATSDCLPSTDLQQQQQQQNPSQKLPQNGSGFRANYNFRPHHDGAVATGDCLPSTDLRWIVGNPTNGANGRVTPARLLPAFPSDKQGKQPSEQDLANMDEFKDTRWQRAQTMPAQFFAFSPQNASHAHGLPFSESQFSVANCSTQAGSGFNTPSSTRGESPRANSGATPTAMGNMPHGVVPLLGSQLVLAPCTAMQVPGGILVAVDAAATGPNGNGMVPGRHMPDH